MKTIALLCLLVLPLTAQNKPLTVKVKNSARIVQEYDRFKDQTRAYLLDYAKMPGVADILSSRETQIQIASLVTSQGRSIAPDHKAHFAVVISSNRSTPLIESKPIYILADDQRFAIETSRLIDLERPRSRFGPRTVDYAVGGLIAWADYKVIAAAGKVEIRVDRFEFELKDKVISNLRAFVAHIEKQYAEKAERLAAALDGTDHRAQRQALCPAALAGFARPRALDRTQGGQSH